MVFLLGDPQHPSWTLATLAPAQGSADVIAHPTSSLQTFGFAINFFFPVLAFLIVALRVYSRVKLKQFSIDDAVITLAMALSMGETVTTYMYMKTNFVGIHIWNVPKEYDVVQANIWNFAVQVLYNPILALVKTSMLLFLLRLGSQKPGVRWTIYALNTFNLSLMTAIFLTVIFQCKPIAYNWDHSIDGHCIQQGTFYVATAGLTIMTDVLALAVPFWIFLDLKMPLRVKVALLFVFLLGGVVTVVSIVRLWFLHKVFFTPPSPDSTHSIGFVLSGVETNLAIICASAPSLRGQIRIWFPHFFSSNRPSGTPYYEDRYRLGDSSVGHNESSPATAAASTTMKGSGRGGRRRGGGGNGTGYGLGSKLTGSRLGKDGGSRNMDLDMDSRTVTGQSSTGSNSIALHELKKNGAGMGIGGLATSHAAAIGGGGGGSPTASEEEIMTYNNNRIVLTTDVRVKYEDDHGKDSLDSQLGGRRSNSITMVTSVNESL